MAWRSHNERSNPEAKVERNMNDSLKQWTNGPFSVRLCHSQARVDSDNLGYAEHGSGWLVAVVQWSQAQRRWLLLTGQHLGNPGHWSPLATASGRPVEALPHATDAQELRADLALLALSVLAGRCERPEALRIRRQTTCAACDKPLTSNALMRTVPLTAVPGANGVDLAGALVAIGPVCWETVTGQREARRLERQAAREADPRWAALAGPVAVAAPAAAPRCPGTCALDSHCPDCDA
jgi:hypothetical protein